MLKRLKTAARRLAQQGAPGFRHAKAVHARVRFAVGREPLSVNFAWERGMPLLRFYMEEFLREHAGDIRGRCLEFQEDAYTSRFGGTRVTSVDVLHAVPGNPHATLIADLTRPNDLPSDRYDTIVCTFVLHIIYDLAAAISELHRILAPGGTLLVGVPHVSMADPHYDELWRFTDRGLARVLARSFGDGVAVRAYGDSLTAAGSLRGLVAEEFTKRELDHSDPRFAVLACARAVKRQASPAPSRIPDEIGTLVSGWDDYARSWRSDRLSVRTGARIEHLGDEWTHEAPADEGRTYGLSPEALEDFPAWLRRNLLDPYLPHSVDSGLEIGPGSGRLTSVLMERTRIVHVVEPSEAMLDLLRSRMRGAPANLVLHRTDGTSLPALPAGSLEYVIAFDVFVHFEPRLAFSYLRQIAYVLAPRGTGIIHYANVLTPGGWKQFEAGLEPNLRGHRALGTFGVMTPELMGRFLEALGFSIVSLDTRAVPRDAVAVFRKPT